VFLLFPIQTPAVIALTESCEYFWGLFGVRWWRTDIRVSSRDHYFIQVPCVLPHIDQSHKANRAIVYGSFFVFYSPQRGLRCYVGKYDKLKRRKKKWQLLSSRSSCPCSCKYLRWLLPRCLQDHGDVFVAVVWLFFSVIS
jgi:hypothetical protein